MTEHARAGGAAPTAPTALSRCTALTASEFARFWATEPLLTRAAELGAGFDDLLDAAAVDELISCRGLRTPFVRMARDGNVLAAREFTRGGGAGAGIADQAADDRVLAQLAAGATLVLQALHRTWPPLVSFGSQLADELGHPVQVNAYITPAQNRGFAPHYDVHDVFVLQVSGRKHWSVHAPVVTDPLDEQNWEKSRAEVSARAEGRPLIDCVLEPGDALYLPRGTIHAAEALGEVAIHLTVGIHPITRYHLVQQLLDRAQQDETLRSSLPMGVDLGDAAVLAPHLTATLDALRDYLDRVPADEIAAGIGRRLTAQTRPQPVAPLTQLAAAEALGHDTVLRTRHALRYRMDEDGERVRVALIDRTVALPLDAGAALKLALSGEPFRPAELPGLDADDQLAVARRLLREGVLVPAGEPL
jgi:bifunctional lysine-specific demethylase and histidyl-hydroxylase NO66